LRQPLTRAAFAAAAVVAAHFSCTIRDAKAQPFASTKGLRTIAFATQARASVRSALFVVAVCLTDTETVDAGSRFLATTAGAAAAIIAAVIFLAGRKADTCAVAGTGGPGSADTANAAATVRPAAFTLTVRFALTEVVQAVFRRFARAAFVSATVAAALFFGAIWNALAVAGNAF
jgi:hypothetical protein